MFQYKKKFYLFFFIILKLYYLGNIKFNYHLFKFIVNIAPVDEKDKMMIEICY